jgi:hypothetical protein
LEVNYIKLNLNTSVTITLTLEGQEWYHDYWIQLWSAGLPEKYIPHDLGTFTGMLWEVMEIFGPHIKMGGPSLFLNNDLFLDLPLFILQ